MIDQQVELSVTTRWQWPVTPERYDRSPELSEDELAEVDLVWQRFQVKKAMRLHQQTVLRLERLLHPIFDVLDAIEAAEYQRNLTVNFMLAIRVNFE